MSEMTTTEMQQTQGGYGVRLPDVYVTSFQTSGHGGDM